MPNELRDPEYVRGFYSFVAKTALELYFALQSDIIRSISPLQEVVVESYLARVESMKFCP